MANEELTKEETIEYLKWIRPQKPWSLDRIKVQKALDMAIEALQEERPQGEWIEHKGFGTNGHYDCEYSCSKCNEWVGGRQTNFCPNCGASMLRGDKK